MPEIRFYHLLRQPLDRALAQVLGKTLGRGWRALVLARDAGEVDWLNERLWMVPEDGFLPHGTAKDGRPQDQPVWIAAEPDNANGATVLFLTGGVAGKPGFLAGFDLVCDVFDGRDDRAVAAARDRWRACKAHGLSLAYWQETETGWVEKAKSG